MDWLIVGIVTILIIAIAIVLYFAIIQQWGSTYYLLISLGIFICIALTATLAAFRHDAEKQKHSEMERIKFTEKEKNLGILIVPPRQYSNNYKLNMPVYTEINVYHLYDIIYEAQAKIENPLPTAQISTDQTENIIILAPSSYLHEIVKFASIIYITNHIYSYNRIYKDKIAYTTIIDKDILDDAVSSLSKGKTHVASFTADQQTILANKYTALSNELKTYMTSAGTAIIADDVLQMVRNITDDSQEELILLYAGFLYVLKYALQIYKDRPIWLNPHKPSIITDDKIATYALSAFVDCKFYYNDSYSNLKK